MSWNFLHKPLLFFPLSFLLFSLSLLLPISLTGVQVVVGLIFITVSAFTFSETIRLLFGRRRNLYESLTLSTLAIFFFFPFTLQFLFFIGREVTQFSSIITLLIPFFLYGGIFWWRREDSLTPKDISERNPFFYFLLLAIIIVLALIFSYKPLPDLDPYAWAKWYENIFENNQLFPLSLRSFFSGLTFLFTSITGLSVFTFFKYLLPFFITTIIFPSALALEKVENWKIRSIFLLYLLSVPSTLLYSITPMPQVIMIITAFYFCLLLMAAREKSDPFYFYVAGLIALLSFFYHQIGAIFFVIWIAIEAFYRRKLIFSDWKNVTILILFLYVFWDIVLKNMVFFIMNWIQLVLNPLILSFVKRDVKSFNPFFPANYTNIDGIAMGWPGLMGVSKYYLYYAGPSTLFVIILLVFFLFSYRVRLKGAAAYLKNKYSLITFTLFIIFFTIAEILPRFPAYAILPDRAWIFCGILILPLVLGLLKKIENLKRRPQNAFYILFIFFALVGISGSLYINFLKRYTITPAQLEAAAWIKGALPQERVIYSVGSSNLLEHHADSHYISISHLELCSLPRIIDILENDKVAAENPEKSLPSTQTIQSKVQEKLDTIIELNPQDPEVHKKLLDLLQETSTLMSDTPDKSNTSVPLEKEKGLDSSFFAHLSKPNSLLATSNKYIFFSPIDPRNPYVDRSYDASSSWGSSECKDSFPMDSSPAFEQIYNRNGILIWKYIPQ